MDSIDPDKCLPPELAIKSVDNHLYRCGLCLTTSHPTYDKSRAFIHKPIVVFLVLFLSLIKYIINFCAPSDDSYVLIVLGDLGHYYGYRWHWSVAAILGIIQCIVCQLIFAYNYSNGIEPTFLHLFQVMAGLRPPNDLGLTDRKHIIRLFSKTRLVFKITNINSIVFSLLSTIIVQLMPYLLYRSLWETIAYGLPNLLLFMIYIYYAINLTIYQFVYFYLLCDYINVKNKSICDAMKSRNKTMYTFVTKNTLLIMNIFI